MYTSTKHDGTTEVRGVGTTVTQGSTYLGDGDSNYWVLVAVPGGEETDGEGWTFAREGTGWYPPRDFVVDAPEEALEAYAAEQAARKAEAAAVYAHHARLKEIDEARRPFRGRTVVVTSGRKVPVGTTGEVFWYGESTYGYHTTWRVGLKTAEGVKHFTAATNVEVVDPEQYAPEAFAVEAAAEEVAA